jgi:hypothetical protein
MTSVASGCSSQGASRGGRKGLRGVRLSVRGYCFSISQFDRLLGTAHGCQWVAEKDEPWRGLWEVVGQILHLGVDLIILWPDLLGLAVDDICKVPLISMIRTRVPADLM